VKTHQQHLGNMDFPYKIIIPARRNSKGFPFKNRKLLSNTLDIIPDIKIKDLIISSDDKQIIKFCKDREIGYHLRSSSTASDDASTRSAILECLVDCEIREDEVILMLYLTYPTRTWVQIERALKFYLETNSRSVLCKKEVNSHPYLCMYEKSNGKGQQIISHDLYRRQDYPKCFEISHFISIYVADEVDKLNNNMYNEDTTFYMIEDVLDVDYKTDWEKISEN